jgi:hypothetical protein
VLYSIDSGKRITRIPHKQEYDIWRSRLTDEQFDAIYSDLMSRIEGSEIQTSSWIPGAHWGGTVFHPIYENACRMDQSAAAKFFGLILWKVVMDHEEPWSFGRYEKDGIPIEGLTYFRLDKPPTS